ncbi:hypothetical protein CSKR_103252, partial [Clonorchis sinensis]
MPVAYTSGTAYWFLITWLSICSPSMAIGLQACRHHTRRYHHCALMMSPRMVTKRLQVNCQARRTDQQTPDKQPINSPILTIVRHITTTNVYVPTTYECFAPSPGAKQRSIPFQCEISSNRRKFFFDLCNLFLEVPMNIDFVEILVARVSLLVVDQVAVDLLAELGN